MIKFLKAVCIGFGILIVIMIASGDAAGAANLTKEVGHFLGSAAHGVSNFVNDL